MDERTEKILHDLEQLGDSQIKNIYINHGARQPLFGVRTGDLKPLAKKYKNDYQLAKDLYNTGNYDAMYLAGMIIDTKLMTKEDFEEWMEKAYCQAIGDYTVAICLADSPLGQEIADSWIKVDSDLYKSAAYYSYSMMLTNLPDENFSKKKLESMLNYIEKEIHNEDNRTRYSMNSFVIACGISYIPLHERAMEVAKNIGKVQVYMGNTSCKTPLATDYINKAVNKGKLGYKRKNVRC